MRHADDRIEAGCVGGTWLAFCSGWRGSFGISVLGISLMIILAGASDAGCYSNDPGEEEMRRPEDFPPAWPETRRVMESDMPEEERIGMLIEIVRRETMEESLKRLDEHGMYTQGRAWMTHTKEGWEGEKEIPLKPGVSRADLICIVSNRRVLKLLEQLSVLPKAEAGVVVGKEMETALGEYNRLWAEQMQFSNYLKKKEYRDPNKPTRFLVSDNEDGTPTLLGVRMKVLALLVIAGNLDLKGTQPVVLKVLEVGIRQRASFYHDPIWDKGACAPMLAWAGVYQRQVLGTAILGTYVDSSLREQIAMLAGVKFKTETLQPYTAMVIRYGRLWDDFDPAKFTGPLSLRYLEPMDDRQFDNLVDAAANARKPQESAPAD